ncbi:MAG: isochorismate synthase [Tannerellaceae bacterium]|nr:isochorismate synthase [Tannerellaceae bacterium]
MTSEELELIDTYIQQNRCFAMYRLPGEENSTIHFIMQTSEPLLSVSSPEELNGRSGFVIAPFRISPEKPALLIQADICSLQDVPASDKTYSNTEKETDYSVPENYMEYQKVFGNFQEPLQQKELDKIVLSRKKVIRRPDSFSPAKAFQKACRQYIRSYVYLFHTPYTGTWLGSTPELLLSGEKEQWHTVALAGTVPLEKGELPDSWNQKNRDEQQVVADYINGQLATLGIRAKEEGPYTVRAAHLAHLKSDFSFHLPDNHHIGSLVGLLHPIPAIAGIPKDTAIDFILKNEGYNRKFYSGFLGELNPAGKTILYVNLRCMEIKEKTLSLYAGSDLLESSIATDEWQETEDKLQTMLSLIDN